MKSLRFTLAFCAVAAAAGLLEAQSGPTALHDLPHAVVLGHVNEVSVDQKDEGADTWDDPVKVRLGAYAPADGRRNFYLGARSADLLVRRDGRTVRFEKILEAFKLDPDPTYELYLQRRADTTEDGDMRRIVRITPQGAEFSVPISAPGLSGGSLRPSQMWSPSGLFVTQMQDDGNYVTYELRRPFDIGCFRAIGTLFDGRIASPQWAGMC